MWQINALKKKEYRLDYKTQTSEDNNCTHIDVGVLESALSLES